MPLVPQFQPDFERLAVPGLIHSASLRSPQGVEGQQMEQEAARSISRWLARRQHGAVITLERLLGLAFEDEEADEEFLLPSEYAYHRSVSLIISANSIMRGNFPAGSASADGAGGIRIEWRRGNREVRLSVPARVGGRTYIYHERNDEYAAEKEVTPSTLAHRLDWLIEA